MKLAASNVDLREEGAGVTVPGVRVVVAGVTVVEGIGACVVALVVLAIVGWAVVAEVVVVALEDSVVELEGGVVVLDDDVVAGGAVVWSEQSSGTHSLYVELFTAALFAQV